MSIFKCPQQLANLRAVYKWGVSDQQGNVIVSPNWDSIGGISNHLVEVFQYLPQRKRAPLRAGLISTQQKIILPVSYRSIQLVKGTYYRVNNGKGFQLWKADKGFVSTLSYDSIISSAVGILLYTESFCHRLDSISNKINQGPYREWLVNDNNRIYATVYDTLYIYRNGDLSLTPLLTDSIGGSSRADEIVLYRNNRKVPFRFEPSQLPAIKEMDPIHPAPLSTLLDSTLIKIKFRTQADSLVLVDDWFLYRRKNLWGYGDTLGNIGVGAQYEELRYKHNKRLAMKYKGKWGFVDDRENFILQPYYDEVGDFIDQGTWIRQNKKYNFIDLQGKILNSNWYESISLTAGNNYLVQLKGKMGLVGKDGREKIGTRYLQVLDFGGGSCLTQTEDGKWFLMDYAENRISKYPYSNVKFLRKSKVYVLMK
ncbi:MAG TPA: WG repeat-containing protein [Cytophagaceae bacterium]|nr:WG repeat-containing protein [Cytophagaceae bacterium]